MNRREFLRASAPLALAPAFLSRSGLAQTATPQAPHARQTAPSAPPPLPAAGADPSPPPAGGAIRIHALARA